MPSPFLLHLLAALHAISLTELSIGDGIVTIPSQDVPLSSLRSIQGPCVVETTNGPVDVSEELSFDHDNGVAIVNPTGISPQTIPLAEITGIHQ